MGVTLAELARVPELKLDVDLSGIDSAAQAEAPTE